MVGGCQGGGGLLVGIVSECCDRASFLSMLLSVGFVFGGEVCLSLVCRCVWVDTVVYGEMYTEY